MGSSFLHLNQHFLKMIVILTGVRWTFNVVLVCVPLMAKEHFFHEFICHLYFFI
jgi:hypothetical protein